MKFRFLLLENGAYDIQVQNYNTQWKNSTDEEKSKMIKLFITSNGGDSKNIWGSNWNSNDPNGVLYPYVKRSIDLYGFDENKNVFLHKFAIPLKTPLSHNDVDKIDYIWKHLKQINFNANKNDLKWLFNENSGLFDTNIEDFKYLFNVFSTLTGKNLSQFNIDKDKVDLDALYDGDRIKESGLSNKLKPDTVYYIIDSWTPKDNQSVHNLADAMDKYGQSKISEYIKNNREKIAKETNSENILTQDFADNLVSNIYDKYNNVPTVNSRIKRVRVLDDLLDITSKLVDFYIDNPQMFVRK